MLLALVFHLLPIAFTSQRVKRQWGPADFYQFEQWVNYVNRPRQAQYSADGPHWGIAQYPGLNRNIQPHTAPPGWQVQPQPYWSNGQWNGYPQPRNRPPVLIETNVFRSNSLVPVPSSVPSGYGRPLHLFGAQAVQPSTTTTTTTTSAASTTTEDESERFIQTAVREDIDSIETVVTTTPEAAVTTAQTKQETDSIGDSEARMNTRSTTPETSPTTVTTEDFTPIWTEGESSSKPEEPEVTSETTAISAHETKKDRLNETTMTTTLELLPTELSTEATLVGFGQTRRTIPEAEGESSGESVSSSTSDPLFEDVTKDFQSDLGLRPPPLPVDIAKKLQELGVSIVKTV